MWLWSTVITLVFIWNGVDGEDLFACCKYFDVPESSTQVWDQRVCNYMFVQQASWCKYAVQKTAKGYSIQKLMDPSDVSIAETAYMPKEQCILQTADGSESSYYCYLKATAINGMPFAVKVFQLLYYPQCVPYTSGRSSQTCHNMSLSTVFRSSACLYVFNPASEQWSYAAWDNVCETSRPLVHSACLRPLETFGCYEDPLGLITCTCEESRCRLKHLEVLRQARSQWKETSEKCVNLTTSPPTPFPHRTFVFHTRSKKSTTTSTTTSTSTSTSTFPSTSTVPSTSTSTSTIPSTSTSTTTSTFPSTPTTTSTTAVMATESSTIPSTSTAAETTTTSTVASSTLATTTIELTSTEPTTTTSTEATTTSSPETTASLSSSVAAESTEPTTTATTSSYSATTESTHKPTGTSLPPKCSSLERYRKSTSTTP